MSELFQCSLLDNSVTGRVKLYDTQSGLIAFRMPREAICNQEDLPELNHPGIYFLFGSERAEDGRRIVSSGYRASIESRMASSRVDEIDARIRHLIKLVETALQF